MSKTNYVVTAVLGSLLLASSCLAQLIDDGSPDAWVVVVEKAAGTDEKAKDEAINKALRRAVEQACGVFLMAESKSKDYQGVYDQVFADAVGYVKEYKVLKVETQDGMTIARVRACVSTQKFEKDWAVIAHTYSQESNPRVIVVIGETTYEMVNDLEQEEKHASVEAFAIQAEAQRSATVTDAGVAGQDTDAAVVTGRFRRRGRVRPQNWAVMSESQRAAWLREVEAEEQSSASVEGVAASQRSDSYITWRRVASEMKEGGTVQTKIEDFFLDKGIKLMDRGTARQVNKRDLMLASAKEDLAEVAALGARFDADVVILGTAAAKTGGQSEMSVAGKQLKQYGYRAKLVVRAIRTDSAQLMVSKVYNVDAKSMQKGGEEKALDRLGDEAAPQLLQAVVEAWRKQVHVTRDIQLQISGMTYDDFKTFQKEAGALRGVKAVNLREITESVANVSVGYEFSTQLLADNLTGLKTLKLEVTEFNPNRLKMKVVK
jgi:hypothetical protein